MEMAEPALVDDLWRGYTLPDVRQGLISDGPGSLVSWASAGLKRSAVVSVLASATVTAGDRPLSGMAGRTRLDYMPH